MNVHKNVPKCMVKDYITDKFRRAMNNESGVVLAAVLIFISLILPVTLVILNTIEIETMLPTNEGYTKIAATEAEKGFDMAIAALMMDNHEGFYGDYIIDPTRPMPDDFVGSIGTASIFVPGMARGRHDLDYLAESWARHPDNYTYFLAEHSRENEELIDPPFNPDPPGEEDEYSVPTRWIMMNVPFGMDDHGERTFNEDYNYLSDILTNIDNRNGVDDVTPVNAFAADDEDPDEIAAPPLYVNDNWMLSSSNPFYVRPRYHPRPASYFRNTNPADAFVSDIYDNEIPDSMVYDGYHDDVDDDGNWYEDTENQYLNNPVLQEAVLDSIWSNLHFGAGNATDRNKEYKPLPGMVSQYPVGSTGDDFLPAWFEAIVSDESSRFNLNTILNIIYQGGNYDYNSDSDYLGLPVIKYDDYRNYDFINHHSGTGTDHSNYSNFLLARDVVTALLMNDEDLKSLKVFQDNQLKADWIIRNMLIVRERLDANYDGDGDGEPDLLDIVDPDDDPYVLPNDPLEDQFLNGRGRMGDAGRPTLGTWQVYNNPKDFLNDPGRMGKSDLNHFTPININDFTTLNQQCTVYTYTTEHIADTPTSAALNGGDDYRVNFNTLSEGDQYATRLELLIGKERLRSLFNWRDGLVDLNADGDLSDEYILQPVKDPATADPDTNLNADSEPVSQITYRERDNINYQDPAQPEYPNMRNIPDLGSLAMVPMSVKETQIIASVNTFELGKFYPDNPGTPYTAIPNSGGALACDIDFTGTAIVYDTFSSSLDDMYWMNIPRGTNQIQMNNAQGFHPSLSPDGTQFCYVDKDVTTGGYSLSIYDILQDAVVQINRNGNVPLAIMSVPLGPGGDFFEAGSPDWSPANANLLAFAGGGTLDFNGNPFSESIHIYTVRLNGPWAGIPTDVTSDLPPGMFALYPDFHPEGEWLAFTLIDLNQLFVPNGTPFMIVKQNLVTHVRQILAARGDVALLTPDWSPDGRKLCLVGAPVLFPGNTDIWTIGQDGSNPQNISQTPGISELYPSWGWGLTLAASQNSNENGVVEGTALAYPSGPINPDNDPWDEDYRDELAQVLQNASLAFRESFDMGEDGAQSNNWRYMDLPVLPQHVVEPLQMIADSITFRPAQPPILPGELQVPASAHQAYPGKININTAPRGVLRALFLLMFQGAVYRDDPGSGGSYHGSAPMIEGSISMGMKPINLAHRSTNSIERRYALAIADTYANQVVEYRRWIYNNQSRAFNNPAYGGTQSFSITPETVPDGLINNTNTGFGDNAGAKSYRANPFAPYDLDNNPMTQDRQMYDPEPPFRSIADLFNVSLYIGDDDANWLHEGYDGDYGPDPEEEVNSRHVIPTSYDPTDPDPDGDENGFLDVFVGPNALAVWGPIYQTEFSITNENHLIGMTADHILEPFENGASPTDKDDPSTRYYKQPRFRLFSADDFKWISPYITTRSYTYRIESRGKVRVANGTNKLDISRDKLWIVDFGRDTYINFAGRDESADPIITEPIEVRWPINGNFNEAYAIRAFEEVPVDGIRLTRGNFTPPRM